MKASLGKTEEEEGRISKAHHSTCAGSKKKKAWPPGWHSRPANKPGEKGGTQREDTTKKGSETASQGKTKKPTPQPGQMVERAGSRRVDNRREDARHNSTRPSQGTRASNVNLGVHSQGMNGKVVQLDGAEEGKQQRSWKILV